MPALCPAPCAGSVSAPLKIRRKSLWLAWPQMTKTKFRAVPSQSATGQTVNFLLQFRPACIERVQISLCRFHFSVSGNELGAVAGNRGVFQCSTFALQLLLGVRNTLLNAGIFSCFEV